MQYIWQRGAGPAPLFLDLQYNYIPVSGLSGAQAPTVEVYRTSDNFVLDWISSLFTSSGSNKFGAMTEVPSNFGLYRRDFDPDICGEQSMARQIYYMRYRAIIPSGYSINDEDINVFDSEDHMFIEVSGGSSLLPMTASFIE